MLEHLGRAEGGELAHGELHEVEWAADEHQHLKNVCALSWTKNQVKVIISFTKR